MPKESRFSTFGASAVLGGGDEPIHYMYVDNLGVIGTDAKKVQDSKDAAALHLDSYGLTTHEHTDACKQFDSLGISLNGEKLLASMSNARLWKVDALLQWALQRKTLSGDQLEIIVGHITFIFLLRRPLLSIVSHVYRFKELAGKKPVEL